LLNSLLHLLLKNSDFLNIDISQGSVATHLGCGGVFKYCFVTNFLLSLEVKKNFENRLIFGEVMGKSLVSCFFDSRCICHTIEQEISCISVSEKVVTINYTVSPNVAL